MNFKKLIPYSLLLISCIALAQHPDKFKYNMNKKDYSISGDEKSAIKSHITDWLKQHDTIITKNSISDIRFTPDDMMLAECDSVAEKISYFKAKFEGFPATDVGTFYGADIYIKNKQGEYNRYTINLSYAFDVVKIWRAQEVYFKKINNYKLGVKN